MSRSSHFAIRIRPITLLITVAALCLGLGIPLLAPPSSALTNGGSVTALGVPLVENFDTLAQTGTGIAWTDNSTIPGWYSTRTTYNSGTGSSNTGALYSFGVTGTNPVTDRALGSVASGGTGTLYQAARLTNNTGGVITSLDISYVGEQWRNGAAAAAHSLTFQYQVANAGVITGANAPASGWATFSPLSFTGPITGTTAAALDGNAPANRIAISGSLPVTVNAGQEIWLRWQDPDDSGSDHGLAIDDFTVTASGSVTPTPTPPVGGTVVISQVYGGGGNSGATLKNDFIEIINRSDTAVNLSGWSVQYFSATLGIWQVSPLTSFTLQPGQYYLIKEAAGLGGTVELPTPDAEGTIAVGSTAGKVALVSNTVALSGDCPTDPAIIDLVGYGEVNCFEGSGPAPTLTNTTAAIRGNSGCFDTNDNAGDFVAGTPNPRNSSSPTHNCTILSGAGSANPNTVQPGDTTTLTVVVFPAPNPPSTGVSVVADLTSIGGAPNQSFSGIGNTYTFIATVAAATTPGMKTLPVNIADAQGRSFSASILLSIQAPGPANHIVISQVSGGGGNSGSTYTNDYIELYNPTAATVTITGWSLQYASATGTTWTNKQPLGGSIGPGEYFLVSLGSGGAGGAPLPVAPNISGEINMAAAAGKIALVSNSDSLTLACPIGADPDIVDFVGYGTTANCHEGNANAPAPSNTRALFRKADGATDTDQNGADFTAAAPNPRRTAPIVELGPWVANTDPITNDTNVPYDATITIDFSEPVDVVGAWYNITCSSSGQHNSATVATYNGFKGYHITPNIGFQFGEQCTVTIFKNQVHDRDLDDSLPDTDTLFDNNTWSFTVVGAGGPAPYPPSVHLTMGNPSDATPTLASPNNYLMEKPTYALSYNRDKGIPNWVSWHLDQSWPGILARVDTFRADPAVPPDWYRVQSTDYFSSGFDRGHMTPNADRDNENRIPINQETYLMSNMVPQSPDNNQGPWAEFENYLRTQLPLDGEQEMYIISGPYGVGGSGSNGGTTTTLADGHVTVPAYTWKVVLILPKGDNDISRASCSSRTIAVLMPNIQGIRNNPWENYLTTVDAIEALTGYDFFSNLPGAVQNCVEAGTNGINPPGTANQSANTSEDTPVTITLRAALPNSNTPTFSIVGGGPTHGSLGGIGAVLCANGDCAATVTYTPGPDYNGADSFNFKVNDGNADSNVSMVSIGVTEINDAPVAANDAKLTNQDTTLNFLASDLTANDLAGPANETGQTLTVTSVNATANAHGTVTLSGGMVTYSPAANYAGPASFNYQVCDNGATNGAPDSKCAVASVNVTVNDTQAPTIICNADIIADFDPAVNGAVVTYTTPIGTDNSPGATTMQVAGLASGSTFPVGVTTNTFIVTDAAGNTSSCSFKVSVALTSLIGLDSVSIIGAGFADSYDSSGGYPATKGSLANIISNGAITLTNSGKVWGAVRSTGAVVAMSGASMVTGNATAGTTISISGSATVGGTTTNNALAPLMTLPAVPACGPSYSSNSGISGTYSYNQSTGDLSLSGVNIATLANGSYCFHNVTLTNSAQLKVNGPVVIKLTGTLNVSGATSLTNTTGIPSNLRILSSYSGANGVTIGSSANVHLMVYAPQTGVSISGAAPLFGSVAGKTITVGNSGLIHYDTRLKAIWPEIWYLIFGP